MRKLALTTAISAGLFIVPSFVFAQGADTIRAAQQALKEKGYDPGEADGVDGPKTRSAVRAFQRKQNLQADGKLGPQTLDGLGVQHASAGTQMKKAGTNVKTSYSSGGKDIAEGSKELGSNIKHGEVVGGAKGFGKGIGEGAAKIGVGTGHAAKNVAKGVKNAVTPGKQ
jgi:peptidoglycan hydrolase-like protein with peptidoglycan-binding domain